MSEKKKFYGLAVAIIGSKSGQEIDRFWLYKEHLKNVKCYRNNKSLVSSSCKIQNTNKMLLDLPS